MAFCTIININVIQAILDVNFPLEVYIELTRKEAQRAAAAVKELEIKGVSYRGRQCSTKDELGREPTLADVETERSSMYTQLEIKLQREYRRARQKAEDENKPTKYLDKLSDAFEEKMGQVKEGFIRDVTAEFEERLEEYQSGIKQLNSLQSQLQKRKGSLQATMKLQSLFECIQYFLQTMFVKLKGSMNHQEIYTKVQETLNKKVKLIGSTTEVLTPFNEGNIFGIWANVTQHYLKATIPLYFEYKERRMRLLTSKKLPFHEKQVLTASLDREEELMNYKSMPEELNELAVFIQTLEQEFRVEALKKLTELCPEFKKKSPLEVGEYLKSKNLKQEITEYLEELHVGVFSSSMAKTGKAQGFRGELDEDGENDDGSGEGYYGSGSGKPDQKKSKKKYEKVDEKKDGSPYLKDLSKQNLGWRQFGTTAIFTTYKDNLPIPKTTDVTVAEEVMVCLNKNSKLSSRFTSVSSPCEKCLKAVLAKDHNKAHTPTCYIKPCAMCGKYGHGMRACLHST
jgi:uncharacterized protein YeeX (DUF496 family)